MENNSLEENESIESLTGQFVLSRDESIIPKTWAVRAHAGWLLGTHAKLPTNELRSVNGEFVGWILGHPIDSDGKLLKDNVELAIALDADSDVFESEIYRFGNRYLVVLLCRNHSRIYLDPLGLLSAVFSSSNQVVASTPNLIPYNEFTTDRDVLAQELGIPYSNATYPLGLTPRHGVDRILPNHFLDLDTWSVHRHWPTLKAEDGFTLEEAIDRITVVTSRQIKAIVNVGFSVLYLTAGYDSRTILACARDVLDRLVCCTVEIPDYSAKLDCKVARSICKKAGLQHRILRRVRPKKKDLDRWLFCTGRCAGEIRGWQAISTYKQLDGSQSEILALAGEVGRGLFWSTTDSADDIISAERLIGSCPAPVNDTTLNQVQRWLDNVPTSDALLILDLFTIEQRGGCWAGVVAYGEVEHSKFQGFPFCHRDIFQTMLFSLPVEYRRRGTLMRDMIDRQWPELLAYPFNTPFGIMRLQPWLINRSIRKSARRVLNVLSDIA